MKKIYYCPETSVVELQQRGHLLNGGSQGAVSDINIPDADDEDIDIIWKEEGIDDEEEDV